MGILTSRELTEALEDAESSFAPDELAYLAMTSKVERPVQDRWAWSLHRRHPDVLVAREWRRADIAAMLPRPMSFTGDVEHAGPVLIELSAFYTYDVVEAGSAGVRKFVDRKLKDDIAKSRELIPYADAYALALATHPVGLPTAMNGAVKYFEEIRRSLRTRSEAEVREAATCTLREKLPELGPVAASGSMDAGEAFGVPVMVDWWLVGPFHQKPTVGDEAW